MLHECLPAALAATIVALWIRRATWPYLWEKAANTNLACFAAALVCAMPQCAPAFDALHRATGLANLEDLVAILLHLVGITVFTVSLIARVDHGGPDGLRRFVTWRITLPATIILPALVGLFLTVAPADHHVSVVFERPGHGSMAAFLLLYVAAVAWVTVLGVWALLIIRTDPASQVIANLYLCSLAAGLVWVVVMPVNVLTGLDLVGVVWASVLVASLFFMAGTVRGMRRIRVWLRPLDVVLLDAPGRG